MGLIEKVRGKTISVDTAPFIYFIEKNPDYIGLVKPIFSGIAKEYVEAITSTICRLFRPAFFPVNSLWAI